VICFHWLLNGPEFFWVKNIENLLAASLIVAMNEINKKKVYKLMMGRQSA
jgi:hypothetical protein